MIFIDIIAAFLMGALSGMGIGGGGLLVIYLTLLRGVGQISAQGLNLYFFIFASVAALFVHGAKRRIDYKAALLLALFGLPAALLGSMAAQGSDPRLLRVAFGVMLVAAGGVSAIRVLPVYIKKRKEKGKK